MNRSFTTIGNWGEILPIDVSICVIVDIIIWVELRVNPARRSRPISIIVNIISHECSTELATAQYDVFQRTAETVLSVNIKHKAIMKLNC
uniref:Uncharacterized protein n=1 Tax=Octopus bimaculoides TaxID=37653 RepID=A0A0L8GCM2_OCTBM